MKTDNKAPNVSEGTEDKIRGSWLVAAFLTIILYGCSDFLLAPSGGVDSLIPQASEIIRLGLADDNPRIRAKAVEVVADTQQVELMPQVQRLLRDDFVPVRFAAAMAIGDMQYHPAKNTVEKLLNAPDENFRIAAAYAMARLGSEKSLDMVRSAVASKDQKIRANAVLLLGKSGDTSSLELLKWAQQDDDSDDKVRLQALEARAKLGDEQTLRRLWAIVYSSYLEDRIIGITAMGALGTAKAKDILITKLDDDVLEVRLTAAEQLGRLKDTTGEPEVLDVFSKNLTSVPDSKGPERVNVLTALAIGQIGTPALTRFLPRLLQSESKRVRLAAAKAVFQVKTARKTAKQTQKNKGG